MIPPNLALQRDSSFQRQICCSTELGTILVSVALLPTSFFEG